MTSLHFKWSCWSALNQNHEEVAPSYFYTLGWVSLLMHSSCEKYTCVEFLNHLMVMMMLIIHPFIHPFSLLLLLHSGSWGFWSLSCLPAVFGRRRGYTLDNFPVLLKAHLKRQKTFLITLTPTAKLELPIHLTCLFLEQSESRRRDTDTD